MAENNKKMMCMSAGMPETFSAKVEAAGWDWSKVWVLVSKLQELGLSWDKIVEIWEAAWDIFKSGSAPV